MSISSFNKLGGSGREILQVSLLLVAKIASGVRGHAELAVRPRSRLLVPSWEGTGPPAGRSAGSAAPGRSGHAPHTPLPPGSHAPARGPPGGLLGVQGTGADAWAEPPHRPEHAALSCRCVTVGRPRAAAGEVTSTHGTHRPQLSVVVHTLGLGLGLQVALPWVFTAVCPLSPDPQRLGSLSWPRQ